MTYYKTEADLETKRTYREKANVKPQITNQLAMLNILKRAQHCHETIEKLVKMLWICKKMLLNESKD